MSANNDTITNQSTGEIMRRLADGTTVVIGYVSSPEPQQPQVVQQCCTNLNNQTPISWYTPQHGWHLVWRCDMCQQTYELDINTKSTFPHISGIRPGDMTDGAITIVHAKPDSVQLRALADQRDVYKAERQQVVIIKDNKLFTDSCPNCQYQPLEGKTLDGSNATVYKCTTCCSVYRILDQGKYVKYLGKTTLDVTPADVAVPTETDIVSIDRIDTDVELDMEEQEPVIDTPMETTMDYNTNNALANEFATPASDPMDTLDMTEILNSAEEEHGTRDEHNGAGVHSVPDQRNFEQARAVVQQQQPQTTSVVEPPADGPITLAELFHTGEGLCVNVDYTIDSNDTHNSLYRSASINTVQLFGTSLTTAVQMNVPMPDSSKYSLILHPSFDNSTRHNFLILTVSATVPRQTKKVVTTYSFAIQMHPELNLNIRTAVLSETEI